MHHAYLMIGNKEGAFGFLADLDIKIVGSPDFFIFGESTFGIKEARALADRAIEKAFTGEKVFLITPEKITIEAQNALLKTFEEPIENTHFFFCVREEAQILSTLRSRMQVVYLVKSRAFDSGANKFLGLSIKDRLKFAKDFEGNLAEFLDQLLVLKRERVVYKMRLFANDRSASSRLILEHLAVVV